MNFIAFMAGCVIGGLIWSIIIYFDLKAKYEVKVSEAYTKGYNNGREIEQRSILDYIEQLRNTGGIVFKGSEE